MLVQGDMLVDLSQFVQPESVDLIILDPPYGIGSKKLAHKTKNWKKSDEEWDQFETVQAQRAFYQRMLGVVWRLLRPTGSIFCFGSYHNIFQCGDILQTELQGKLINSITWYKQNAMFSVTRSSLIESSESAIWVGKTKEFYFNYEASKAFNNGQQLRNVWTSPITENSERVGHPHQKPTWLYHRLIKIACPPEGFVLDPMCGSGTTAVVCESAGLKYLCMEKSEKFFQMAKERMANQPQPIAF